jgi:hypothetical protein
MKIPLHRLSLLALAATPFLVPHARAALDAQVVAADARWLLHLDLDALRESALGHELTAAFAGMQPPDFGGGIRIDLQKLLATAGAATAYGVNLSKDPQAVDGTLVLRGTPDLRTIAEGLVAQMTVASPDEVSEIAGLPFEAYEMKGGVSVAFPPEPVVILSKSKEQLAKARDVVRGVGASLAQKPSALAALTQSDAKAFLVAASIVPSAEGLFDANQPQARILRMANSAALILGESGEMTSAQVRLVASDATMADKLQKILQGMAAIASLAEGSDEMLNKFLQSVNVTRSANTVNLSLAYPTARLVEMAKGMAADETHASGPEAPARPKAPDGPPFPDAAHGTTASLWAADAQLGDDAPTPGNFASHEIPSVALERGSIVTVSGMRDGGEHARIDYVEFTPTTGSGAPLRQEAEYIRLEGYRIEKVDFASGGELVMLSDSRGSAGFVFPGATGTYRITVRYVDETDGRSSFAVSVRPPSGS